MNYFFVMSYSLILIIYFENYILRSDTKYYVDHYYMVSL